MDLLAPNHKEIIYVLEYKVLYANRTVRNFKDSKSSKSYIMRYFFFKMIYLLVLGLLVGLCLDSCVDQCDEGHLDTFFEGNKGGEKLKGDGIAFTRDSSSVLHVRLLAGDAEFYDGIDIVINYESSGSYIIPEGKGSLAEVYGLDAVGDSFLSDGLPSDIINLDWNTEMG